MMHGHEKSDPEIVAIDECRWHSPGEAGEQCGPSRGGVGGAKGRDQGKCGPAKHAPGSGPGRCVPGAGPHTASREAQQEGTVHRASPSRQPRNAASGVQRPQKDAAPGVDGTTWSDYEVDLERRLEELHDRVHRGAYRPQPSRRVYIPKADGRQRPHAVAAVEDKIVQGAVAMVLSAIYEVDFLGFSYGFRPGPARPARTPASTSPCAGHRPIPLPLPTIPTGMGKRKWEAHQKP